MSNPSDERKRMTDLSGISGIGAISSLSSGLLSGLPSGLGASSSSGLPSEWRMADMGQITGQITGQIAGQITGQFSGGQFSGGQFSTGQRVGQLSMMPSVEMSNREIASRQVTFSTEDWSSLTREALNSLPQAWTRGLLYLLALFALIILPWAMVVQVDEIGSAKGRLEPKGKTFRIDAPISGTVAAIQVKEGQTVAAGQSLLELDQDVTLAELQQTQVRLDGLNNRLVQLESLRTQVEFLIQTQRSQSQARQAEQLAQIHQVRERFSFHQATIAAATELVQKDRDRLTQFQTLKQAGIISGMQVENVEREMIQNQQQLQQAEADFRQSQAELSKQQRSYEKVMREGDVLLVEGERQLRELKARITDVQTELKQTRARLRSLQYQWQQHIFRAPIDGTVFQFPIQHPGAVVQPGQMVAQIAPKGARLVLRSQIDSEESGFLRTGLPVKVKLDAYPFQDYGIIPGRLSWISPDSKPLQTTQGTRQVFELEIELDRATMSTPQKPIVLTPGQSATAEIVLRQRRMIDFFLDPFKQLQQGGLKL